MNRMGWREIVRKPDDEGGGGAEGGVPASDTITALQERLARTAQQVEDLTKANETAKTRSDLQRFESDLNRKLAEATTGVDTAEAQLAAALDDGDALTIAKKQRALAEAVADKERAAAASSNFQQRLRDAERRAKEAPRNTGGDEGDPTNLNQWKNRHTAWYGVDRDMTKSAHEIDASIRAAGVIPVGSKEYFDAIDRQMKQKYPDQFGGAPTTDTGRGGAPRAGAGAAGRIPQSVVDGWRRMGIDTNNPETIKRMLAHRQTAVDKGILPQEMIRDRVVTR